MRQARKAGVPPHKQVAWVRRKLGSSVVVWRRTADGALACAAPCLFCNRELQKFDLRVLCTLGDGQWFSGRLSEEGAPTPALTGGQKKVLRKQRWKLCQRKTLPEKQEQERQQAQQRRQQAQQQQQQQQQDEPAPQQQAQAHHGQRAGGQQQLAQRQQPPLLPQQQRQGQQRPQLQPPRQQGRRQRRQRH